MSKAEDIQYIASDVLVPIYRVLNTWKKRYKENIYRLMDLAAQSCGTNYESHRQMIYSRIWFD